MKRIILLLPLVAIGQSLPPQPTGLRLLSGLPQGTIIPVPVIRGTNNPLSLPHLGLAAYWTPPDKEGIWVSEWNIPEINGTNWTRSGNHASINGWHWTETGTNWTTFSLTLSNQWSVRIRNIGFIPPPPLPQTNNLHPGDFITSPPGIEQ